MNLTHLLAVFDTNREAPARVPSRSAISVVGSVAGFLLICAIAAGTARSQGSGGIYVLLTVVAVLLVNIAVDIVLDRTRWSHRDRYPVPVSELVVRFAATGLMIAAALKLLRSVVDVNVAGAPLGLNRIGSNEGFIVYPLLTIWLGLSVNLMVDLIHQARHLRHQAIVEHSRSLEIRQQVAMAAASARHRVNEIIGPELQRLRSVAVTNQDPRGLSTEIRSTVDRSMRPVGDGLWHRPSDSTARIRPGEVLRQLVFEADFRPLPIISLTIIIPLASEPQLLRSWGLLAAVLAAVAVWVECTVANRIMNWQPSSRAIVLPVMIFIFAAQSIFVDRISHLWGVTPTGRPFIIVVLLTVVLVGLTSTFGSYRDLNETRAMAFATAIKADHLEAAARAQALSDETRALASLLHGRVQSRLLGAAMAIDFAGDDPDALQAALQHALAVLDDEWLDPTDAPIDRLGAVVAVWSPLATIDITNHVVVTDQIVLVVEELIANAVRHGEAGHIAVRIEEGPHEVTISAVDDGTTGGVFQRPGLGTAILDHVSEVDRSPSPSGWTVTAHLPKSVPHGSGQ